MKLVRAIKINRRRSGIADIRDALKSPWQVYFELKPRPGKAWDEHFERAVFEETGNKGPYDYRLSREATDGSYLYGPRRRRRLRMFLQRLLGKRSFGVTMTCPPSAEHLQLGTTQLARLVGQANVRSASSALSVRELAVAEQVASQRLGQALKSIEKDLRKASVPMANEPPQRSREPSRS